MALCGIAGIVDLRGKRIIDRDLVVAMNDSQSHRGPDGSGYHHEPGVGFGHRRLSIIDIAAGQQPMYNEDGSVVTVYNGEIYNYRELAAELESLGHEFKTHCDTEVIVHGWEEWGPASVRRFRGMFAFALWDRRQDTLFLARDRLGIKPLYYTSMANGSFAFASELKGLMAIPGLSREIDPQAVEDYFAFGYVPDPKTIFANIKKLEPGCCLTLKVGKALPHPVRYWDLPFTRLPDASLDEIQEEVVRRLRQAVEMRLIAEVPLGAFLSGGVDSSAVVASMAGLSTSPVTTCSISFGDPAYNESVYAEQVARKFRTVHHVEQVEADDYSLLGRLSGVYDEPYADSSAIPTYRVCQLARKHVTVALSGDGGDENFAGYRRYRWFSFEERFRKLLPGAARRMIFGIAGALYPKADWAPRVLRAKATLQAIARDTLEGYFHGVCVVDDAHRRRMLSDRLHSQLDGYRAIEVFREHAARCPAQDSLSLVQYLDFKTYLPGDILTKVDRASMAHSLEVRVPLLDHELVEWISGLPAELKLRGREGKYIFKRALEAQLPREILYRSKMGFAVPLARWFRGPLRQRVEQDVLSTEMLDSGYFRQSVLRGIIKDHVAGQRDYSPVIWSLLMFSSFLRARMSSG